MERILSLAAEKSRPEPLSFVQPAQRRDKVQCHAVSQSSSPRGLPVFTFRDDGGGRRRREHRGHALATARRPAAGLPLMVCAAAGWGLVSGAVSCRSRWDSWPRVQTRDKAEREICPLFRVARGLTRKHFVS